MQVRDLSPGNMFYIAVTINDDQTLLGARRLFPNTPHVFVDAILQIIM